MRLVRSSLLLMLLGGSPLFAQNLVCTPNGDGTMNCTQQTQTATVQSIDATTQPAAAQPVAAPPAQQVYVMQPNGQLVPAQTAQPAQQTYVLQNGQLVPVQTAQPVAVQPTTTQVYVVNSAPQETRHPQQPFVPETRRSGIYFGVSFSLGGAALEFDDVDISIGGFATDWTLKLGGGNDDVVGYLLLGAHAVPDPSVESDYDIDDPEDGLTIANFGIGATIYGKSGFLLSGAIGGSAVGWEDSDNADGGMFVRFDLGFEGGKKSAVGFGIIVTYQLTNCDDYKGHFFGVGLNLGLHGTKTTQPGVY